MNARHSTTKTIVIIGGGVSGALNAYHLVRQHVDASVVVIDPRPELGLGLPYSTPSLRHLLNVPAGKISALLGKPNHFVNWLRRNSDPEATVATFAPRAVFGQYVRSLLAGASGLTPVQALVVDLQEQGAGAVLTLDNGRRLWADFVVLATGNFDRAGLPGVERAAVSSGAYRHNAWLPDTYSGLSPDAPVTLIGTGLTAVDVLLRLRELGHRGPITAVSRHGIFPNRHAPYTPTDRSAIPSGTPKTCVAYLRALRGSIASGMEWRAAIDSLRASTNDLWISLPLTEQRRFRRHLQRHWDVVRHRMAPPIADLIEKELADGTLFIREGYLASVQADQAGATVSIRTARGTDGFETTRVINCTGPNMNYRGVDSPLLASLFKQGLATSGPLGGGFNTPRSGALIALTGEGSETIFNLGPGRLGTMLESIAIPEIRQQSVEIASLLAVRCARHEPNPNLTLASQYLAPPEIVITAAV